MYFFCIKQNLSLYNAAISIFIVRLYKVHCVVYALMSAIMKTNLWVLYFMLLKCLYYIKNNYLVMLSMLYIKIFLMLEINLVYKYIIYLYF